MDEIVPDLKHQMILFFCQIAGRRAWGYHDVVQDSTILHTMPWRLEKKTERLGQYHDRSQPCECCSLSPRIRKCGIWKCFRFRRSYFRRRSFRWDHYRIIDTRLQPGPKIWRDFSRQKFDKIFHLWKMIFARPLLARFWKQHNTPYLLAAFVYLLNNCCDTQFIINLAQVIEI